MVDVASTEDRSSYDGCGSQRSQRERTGLDSILDLINTVNGMIDRFTMLSADVAKVARKFGTEGEGKLGVGRYGQHPGIWQETMDGFMGFITVEASGEMDRIRSRWRPTRR